MNTRVCVQRRDPDLGDDGKRDWKPTGAKLWVSIEQLKGEELTVAQQLDARATLKLATHWQPGIQVTDRLVTESSVAGDPLRTFNIVAANNVRNMNRELEFTCVEIVSGP